MIIELQHTRYPKYINENMPKSDYTKLPKGDYMKLPKGYKCYTYFQWIGCSVSMSSFHNLPSLAD